MHLERGQRTLGLIAGAGFASLCRVTTSDTPPAARERRELHQREHLIATIAAEYQKMAGLSLTQAQARRLFGIEPDRFERILAELVDRGIVRINADGLLVRS